VQLKIEKLIFGGQALARKDGQVFFVWGGLPGELVEVEITKKGKGFCEGVVKTVVEKSPERIEPVEKHFALCSPWQNMSSTAENKYKVEIAQETYRRLGKFEPPKLEIAHDERELGYRNKMEYNFVQEGGPSTSSGQVGRIRYALFERRSHNLKAIDVCELGEANISRAASALFDWLNQSKVGITDLHKVIFRGNRKGEVVAALFVRSDKVKLPALKLDDKLVGLSVYLGEDMPLLLKSYGQDYLVEEINGVPLRFGLLSFFQINVPIFKMAVSDMAEWVKGEPEVLDFFAGVGAISLPLNKKFDQGVLVESNADASADVAENIEKNKIANCRIESGDADMNVDILTIDSTVIFDPPRAGLGQAIIERILVVKPKKVIYLSCDLATQARDLGKLIGDYEIKFAKLYNFFPRTPHIEGLMVLERRGK